MADSLLRINGLSCATGGQRRAEFLKKHGHQFGASQLESIKAKWQNSFTPKQDSVRDNRVFFNFTTSAIANGGAAELLENFGGEVINMPLTDLPEISQIIRSLGSLLLVKSLLKPS